MPTAIWTSVRYLWPKNRPSHQYGLFPIWVYLVRGVHKYDHAHCVPYVHCLILFSSYTYCCGTNTTFLGAISGIGGGGILTSVMITVSDVVSLEKRGTYQGVIGVVVALSNSIGPLIGGLFTGKVSWRWCFVSLSVRDILIDANVKGHTVHQHSLDWHFYSSCLASPASEESERGYAGQVQANRLSGMCYYAYRSGLDTLTNFLVS